VGPAVTRTEPVTYLAIASIVSRLLARSPFGEAGFDPAAYTADLPTTAFVAENEGATVMRVGEGFRLRLEGEPWKPWPGRP